MNAILRIGCFVFGHGKQKHYKALEITSKFTNKTVLRKWE